MKGHFIEKEKLMVNKYETILKLTINQRNSD